MLALIGFIGGLITGISPCILPVLPVIFFSGGVQGARSQDGLPGVSRWRPYLVILGLITSFSLVTLVGSVLLSLLGLPQDVLRWAGIVVLILIGVGLIVPGFQHLLEKPFSRIPQKAVGTDRGGFPLGLALGAVYVPCAGPVLAAITVAGTTGQVGAGTIVLTLSFAIGAAVPLLVFALAGRRVAERVKSFRKRQKAIRITGGIVMIALSVGLILDVPQLLQRLVPDYTSGLQNQIAESSEVQDALTLGGLVNDENKDLDKCTNHATELQRCGTAPSITGIQEWFNTPGNKPIDLASQRGKVVLVDFWAYSCINCQRSIPHVAAWYDTYKDVGLQVIGIHSPEYAFEKEPRNVKAGAKSLGIHYPVAIDNNLSTWTNYRNRYWPASYLIDAEGVVRNISFGEGDYDSTEKLIRELLKDADPGVQLPPPTDTPDETPSGPLTRETYLGATKQVNFAGSEPYRQGSGSFTLPDAQPENTFALGGDWKLDSQSITPEGDDARIRLSFTASHVQMVLSGEGTVTVTVAGKTTTVPVTGTPRAYEIFTADTAATDTLAVSVSPGVAAYSFTFG
ncbi:cytochrome c biogenesis protein DipZ [Cryobacterium tepidiphilum]|uniref:Cytochrome c biogenesis protein DipZ n=1 Tax=Cryobacterium tepidiphilum TaxID=2486026 RepID=A0A3M8LDR4_9MICO|nr:cytochrome c biogenesis protein DipZ [Cryobacterium tepidiphilum]RNE63616.1 cytochrome c biogenesis protein DipZ [Cryobacterium tepidiphilum]